MNIEQILKQLAPQVHKGEDALISDNVDNYGWNHTLFDKNLKPLGSGCSTSKNIARRIAIAEVLERALFNKLYSSDLKSDFLLGEYPTTCGFALGFENKPTLIRSMCESFERWAWSKWIDEKLSIPEVRPEQCQFTKLTRYFIRQFDNILLFHKNIKTELDIDTGLKDLHIGIFLGLKKNGIFPGSRVSFTTDDVWEHGAIEAFRHYNLFKLVFHDANPQNVIEQRVKYYSENAEEAIKQIPRTVDINWPTARLRLKKRYNSNIDHCYLWRSLCHDYLGWEKGDVSRFIY